MLISSAEKVIQAVKWRTVNYLNPPKSKNKKESFRFRSTKPAPAVPELKAFEDDVLKLVESVKFNNKTNEFQKKLKKDSFEIKSETKVFIAADKTSNFTRVNKCTMLSF